MTRLEFLKILPGLIKEYQPTMDVLDKIHKLTLLMIIGPSGVGKTTIIDSLGLKFVPSDTTRPARADEQDGVDMNFRSDYDQVVSDIRNGWFVQIALGASGDIYATKDSSYPASGTAVMPVMADGIPIFRRLGFAKTISVFITPPDFDEWMRRMVNHPASEEERAKRLREARRSIEFALTDKEVHFILNDKVNAAVTQIKDLLGEKINQEREAKARKAAQSLLAALA